MDAKLERAREHLRALDAELLAFTKSTKHNFVLKTDATQSETWIVYWVDDPYPPIRLSVLIGDCLFNTRSALDNLICGLVRVHDPAGKCADTRFPIYAERESYKKIRDKALKGVPAEALAIIDELQPCNRPAASAQLDPLYILNALCNQDKHRAAHLMIGYSRNTRLRIHDGVAGVVRDIPVNESLYAEAPAIIPIPGLRPNLKGETRVEAMGTAVVAFRNDGPWRDRAVRDVLSNCLDYVTERVVKRCKPFFERKA